jgi:hypothetical protein
MLQIGVDYSIIQGNYFNNSTITKTIINNLNFFSPTSTNQLNTNFLIEKYSKALTSTVRFKANYSISNYKNKINNSQLRDNKSTILNVEFFYKTAFKKVLNFENIIEFKNISSSSIQSESFLNNSIKNTFRLIIKPNKNFILIATNQYYLPNNKQTENSYSFNDIVCRYTPKHKKFDITFDIKNINNITHLNQINTSDYSINNFQTNLIERYFLFGINYNF